MISYNLAKELKDARFPQHDIFFYWSAHTTPPTYWRSDLVDEVEDHLLCAAPTLSELIEACGDCGLALIQVNTKGWIAQSGYDLEEWGDYRTRSEGPIPEEAVARLWLALNRKEK